MNLPMQRRAFLAVAGTVSLAGCVGGSVSEAGGRRGSSGGGDDTPSTDSRTPTATPGGPPSTDSSTPTPASGSGGGPPVAEATNLLSYSMESLRQDVRSGGVPKDGIPSIDEPTFISATEADEWLDGGDIVFGVARGDDVKAYPQRILVWHEIVNDVIDGRNVTVSYCPLTGTAMGFERGRTTFGVSGNLLNSNLVMYDRATDSRWPQVLGTAIEGAFAGTSLREFRVIWTTWSRWKRRYPDTVVLSKRTGFARNYGRDPYGAYNPKRGYYSDKDTLFPPLTTDERHHPKTIIMGSRTADGAISFVKDALRDDGLLIGDLGGVQYVAVYDPTLDTAYVYRNPEERSFTFTNGRVRADDGERYAPDELPLDRLLTFDAMWFAWSGFYPETNVYE